MFLAIRFVLVELVYTAVHLCLGLPLFAIFSIGEHGYVDLDDQSLLFLSIFWMWMAVAFFLPTLLAKCYVVDDAGFFGSYRHAYIEIVVRVRVVLAYVGILPLPLPRDQEDFVDEEDQVANGDNY